MASRVVNAGVLLRPIIDGTIPISCFWICNVARMTLNLDYRFLFLCKLMERCFNCTRVLSGEGSEFLGRGERFGIFSGLEKGEWFSFWCLKSSISTAVAMESPYLTSTA